MANNFKSVEAKWQKKWKQKKVFQVRENPKEKKFYVLEMYPYPSGSGLHMGHAFNYTIGDICARFKRMQGFNVLYPMGYDSFGLPAENAAIKAKSHPKKFTEAAIKNFIKQQKELGLSYDWDRILWSHNPEYYKWNQWFFLKMFEQGLAYRKKASVNWCSKCNTVLANEQVHSGKCWRHGDTEVEIKYLEQWFIRTTKYAEELLENIDKLDWPERIKTMQKNWIGRSEGTEIDFEIENIDDKISNVVIVHGSNSTEKDAKSKKWGPENLRHWKPWLKKELEEKGIKVSNELYPKDWLPDYGEWKRVFEKNRIDEHSILIGHSAGTAFLLRWLSESKKKVSKLILVAPSVIKDGKYLGLSKLKDFEFDSSLKNHFDNLIVFYSEDDDEDIIHSAKGVNKKLGGKLINLSNRGHFTLDDMKTEKFPELLEEITSKNEKWKIFTTRPDTIFGVTFMVVSAQHPKLMELVTKEQKKQIENFLHRSVYPQTLNTGAKKIKSTKQEDIDKLEKEGVFTGSYAINPMTKEKVPVWVGNFVVADYGSGMVMAVPAHDQRDFEFAKKYGIEIREVIQPVYVNLSGSDAYRNKEPKVERKAVVAIIKNPKNNKYLLLQWKKNDWRGFVIGGVEASEDLLTAAKREIEEETGYTDVKFIRKIEGVVHSRFYHEIKKQNREAHFETLYFELNSDKRKKISEEENKIHSIVWVDEDKVDDFLVRDNDILIIWRRFRGHEYYGGAGILINSGNFNGLDSEEAKEHISIYLKENKLGRKTVNYKLKDWLVSRQRFWGTPIPIIYCEKCGVQPVKEKDLPVILPENIKFSGSKNPLIDLKSFVNVKCPKCKGKARRETDTMDTFFDSSWYYFRFCDSKNKKNPFDKSKVDYWMPVNQYIGGAEHACMHLIYARFFTKFLRDLHLIKIDEPFAKLFNQGMLHGEDGSVMSKSRGNVVNPAEIIKKYSADILRFYLVSNALPDKDFAWSDKAIEGSLKFVRKVVAYFADAKFGKSSNKIESKINKTIKEVTEDLEDFRYNLAVIKLRQVFESFENEKISKQDAESFLKMFSVFCPHISEEIWEKLGNKNFISLEKWPVCDEKKIDEKLEEQEEMISKLKSDIEQIKKLTGKENPKIYVYVLPNELQIYKNLGGVKVFAVNDKNKYDPENKSKKVKPGRPGIYLE